MPKSCERSGDEMYKENMDAELLCLECPYPDCMNKSSTRASCPFIWSELKKREKKAPRQGDDNGAHGVKNEGVFT